MNDIIDCATDRAVSYFTDQMDLMLLHHLTGWLQTNSIGHYPDYEQTLDHSKVVEDDNVTTSSHWLIILHHRCRRCQQYHRYNCWSQYFFHQFDSFPLLLLPSLVPMSIFPTVYRCWSFLSAGTGRLVGSIIFQLLVS